MAEQTKKPAVAETWTAGGEASQDRADKVADARWFLDALEDDDVREALKSERSPNRRQPV